jgi:ComF family protein
VEAGAPLCPGCDRRLQRIPLDRCRLCQELEPAWGLLCADCELAASPLDACVAAVRFAADVETWIHRLKYPRAGLRGLDPAPLTVVAALLREASQRAPGDRPGLVVPVPLHPRRLRARGFNPAGLLARSLASQLRIPRDLTALRRVRDTPSQTGLDRRARRRNLRGALRARRGLRVPERVWIVDDVVTTGSTLREAALALRRAGADTVIGVCAARTLRSDS